MKKQCKNFEDLISEAGSKIIFRGTSGSGNFDRNHIAFRKIS